MTVSRKWWIAVMLFLLSTINCVDRLVLASVAPISQSTLHLTNTDYSYIVFAFMAGMTLGQIPAGVLLDRIGARLGLPMILVGWSIVNVLHVGARQVGQFFGLRLAMGISERQLPRRIEGDRTDHAARQPRRGAGLVQ